MHLVENEFEVTYISTGYFLVVEKEREVLMWVKIKLSESLVSNEFSGATATLSSL